MPPDDDRHEHYEGRRSAQPAFWRALEGLGLTRGDGAPDVAEREFPAGVTELAADLSRRNFLRLLGASAALAGLGACTREPAEKILPWVNQPPELIPGTPQRYATAMELDGYATGLLVESHEGHPTKIEGNPDHPASLGAAGVLEQASVLQLYDPSRARDIRHRGRRASWRDFLQTFAPAASSPRSGLRVLLQPTGSPLVADLAARLMTARPDARIYSYAPLARSSSLEGTRLAFGRPLCAQYDFRSADVVIALDADFLATMPFSLRYARHFAQRRHPGTAAAPMCRLYTAESTPTPTGVLADHRLRTRAIDVLRITTALATELLSTDGAALPPGRALMTSDRERAWIRGAAADLRAAAGRSIVIAGDQQPAVVHALAHLMNTVLVSTSRAVAYTEPTLATTGVPDEGLTSLLDEVRAGAVRALVILGGNPSYDAPSDLAFPDAIRTVPETAYVGLYRNETARDCAWQLPAAHYLESWGDVRAYDGTASIVQPLIAPLYGGRTIAEFLATLAGMPPVSAHDLVRDFWQSRARAGDFPRWWAETLGRGTIADSAAAPVAVTPRPGALEEILRTAMASIAQARHALEVTVRQDHRLYDGRFANNAWLQELPDPVTKIAWGNAALISPATAEHLDIHTGDLLRLERRGRRIELAAFILPGQVDESITLHVGHGRRGAEQVADGVGTDVYPLWTTDQLAVPAATDVTMTRVLAGGSPVTREVVTTQAHWTLAGRPIVRSATIAQYEQDPDFTRRQQGRVLSLYTPKRYDTGEQWAMTIDLALCTGCSACVVACQAENNIPVVGREGVRKGREMHWLRIDRYFAGLPDEPEIVTQPMLCQHCEKAPCEYVCPVNATVHSPDGLNEMVYNRCVGTRFCSNNCPYKVRRFNWFDYNAELDATERLVRNPQVTVRDRGVMEKCTFCVQRIRRAQIAARVEERPLRDGDVVTACQQACPTHAIVFGSLTDPGSDLVRHLAERRRYQALHDRGTEPRVHYLARITNPNPGLVERGDE